METNKDLVSSLIAEILLWGGYDEETGREGLEELLESLIQASWRNYNELSKSNADSNWRRGFHVLPN